MPRDLFGTALLAACKFLNMGTKASIVKEVSRPPDAPKAGASRHLDLLLSSLTQLANLATSFAGDR